MLSILSLMAVFSSIGLGSGIEDSQAREQAMAAVRVAMNLPSTHFLKAVRCEDMEDELFSFQVKIKGKIAKYAYVYEVTEGGYEIISPDEVVFHSFVDGSAKWYVAVARQSGTAYGLLGTEKAAAEFDRLARDARVRIEDDAQAINYSLFIGAVFWEPNTEPLSTISTT